MARFKSADFAVDDLPEDEWFLMEILDTEDTVSKYEGKEQDQVLVKFEVVEGEHEGAKPRGYFNATFGPRAHLRKLAAAVQGVDVDDIEDLDTDALKGKRVYVMGDYGEDGKSNYWKPKKFKSTEGGGRRRRKADDEDDAKEDKDKTKGRDRRRSDDDEEKKEDTTRRRRRSEAPDEDERTTRRRATAGTSSKSDSKDDDGDIDF